MTGDFDLFKIPIPTGHIWDSFLRVFLGLVAGIIVGVPLGLYMGLNRFAKGFFDPLIELYRPVPPLAKGGTGLYNSISGSKNPLANLLRPIYNPSGTPTIIPATNPRKTLKKESQICPVGIGILNKSKSPVTKLKTLLLKLGLISPFSL